MPGGLAAAKWPRLDLWSLLESSPGLGRLGSLRLRFIATAEVRRELALPGRGEPRLLPAAELRRLMSAAFMVAAAASETEEERGEGVSRRLRYGSMGWAVEYVVRV